MAPHDIDPYQEYQENYFGPSQAPIIPEEMPQANKSTMTGRMVNGDVPPSRSLNHLVSLPAVSTGIDAFRGNPVGERIVSIANQGHESFIAPALPYVSTPFDYVQPYAVHLDTLAEDGLSRVEDNFPIIRQDVGKITGAMKGMATHLVFFPYEKILQAYVYISSTYYKEQDRCGGKGLIAGGTAIVTTQLSIAGDALAVISSIMTRRK